MKMLEKVARALAKENSLPESDWPKFDGDARAALEAMREADAAMLWAARQTLDRGEWIGDAYWRKGHTAMIDAILAEKPEGE